MKGSNPDYLLKSFPLYHWWYICSRVWGAQSSSVGKVKKKEKLQKRSPNLRSTHMHSTKWTPMKYGLRLKSKKLRTTDTRWLNPWLFIAKIQIPIQKILEFYKGHMISKAIFVFLTSPKNEKNWLVTTMIYQVKSFSFVFFGESRTP